MTAEEQDRMGTDKKMLPTCADMVMNFPALILIIRKIQHDYAQVQSPHRF